jgi:transposase-like protein
VAEVLPLLYLHGLSTGVFVPTLDGFLGSAAGLSSATITRLSTQWTDDDHAFDGTKQLIALADRYRESTRCWADLLHHCTRRGMRAPVLAVGDGRWFHTVANVLSALPKSAHPGAKAALAEINNAEDKRHAQAAAKAFSNAYGAKFRKATTKNTDDLDVLLTFYDHPAEHWIHLRTTSPIESTFVTVRHRTRVTKGAGSRAAGLAIAFKLIESAQQRWRAVSTPHLVALVRARVRFDRGHPAERPEAVAA